ncbi:hypothetical protein T484DRAFT_1885609 [Baffinella frigidus]|nr:hypothetical protein T484DRAFT_1885609 [Cryptophyta sp. CCMP2293]
MRQTLTQQLRRQRMEAATKGLSAAAPQPSPTLAAAPSVVNRSSSDLAKAVSSAPLEPLDSTSAHPPGDAERTSRATGAAVFSPTKPDHPSPTKSGGTAHFSPRFGRVLSSEGVPLVRDETFLGGSFSTGHRKGLAPLETGVEAGDGREAAERRHFEAGEGGQRRHFEGGWEEGARPARSAKEEQTRLATMDFLQEMQARYSSEQVAQRHEASHDREEDAFESLLTFDLILEGPLKEDPQLAAYTKFATKTNKGRIQVLNTRGPPPTSAPPSNASPRAFAPARSESLGSRGGLDAGRGRVVVGGGGYGKCAVPGEAGRARVGAVAGR